MVLLQLFFKKKALGRHYESMCVREAEILTLKSFDTSNMASETTIVIVLGIDIIASPSATNYYCYV
jgi:hypothetical protein